MDPNKGSGGQRKLPVNIVIADQEWSECSMEKKVRLLYRLRQSNSALGKLMVHPISELVEEEKKHLEIDFDATIKRYEDVTEWAD